MAREKSKKSNNSKLVAVARVLRINRAEDLEIEISGFEGVANSSEVNKFLIKNA